MRWLSFPCRRARHEDRPARHPLRPDEVDHDPRGLSRLLLPDHAPGSLGGLAAFPEAEALDVAVCGDPQRLCRRLHLVDLHLGRSLLGQRNDTILHLKNGGNRLSLICLIDMQT